MRMPIVNLTVVKDGVVCIYLSGPMMPRDFPKFWPACEAPWLLPIWSPMTDCPSLEASSHWRSAMWRVVPKLIPFCDAHLFVPICRPIIPCPAFICSSVKSRVLRWDSRGPRAGPWNPFIWAWTRTNVIRKHCYFSILIAVFQYVVIKDYCKKSYHFWQ